MKFTLAFFICLVLLSCTGNQLQEPEIYGTWHDIYNYPTASDTIDTVKHSDNILYTFKQDFTYIVENESNIFALEGYGTWEFYNNKAEIILKPDTLYRYNFSNIYRSDTLKIIELQADTLKCNHYLHQEIYDRETGELQDSFIYDVEIYRKFERVN